MAGPPSQASAPTRRLNAVLGRPAHAGSATGAPAPRRLPPAAAAVWGSLTAPRPPDAASSRASTLSYQKRGGAAASAAYQRRPRPRRARWNSGQKGGDWSAAALRGGASAGPRPPLPFSAGRQEPRRPDRNPRRAGGRSEGLSAGAGCWARHPSASSDMVAPGSVTSRLGSVFPFLLVLVDLQYEGESCAAWREEWTPGPALHPRSLPAPPRLSRGGSDSGGGGEEPRKTTAEPRPEPAARRGPEPGSGFEGKKLGDRRAAGPEPRVRGARSRAAGPS